jgi:hypothetical protein
VQIKAEVIQILKDELENLKSTIDRDKSAKKGKRSKSAKGGKKGKKDKVRLFHIRLSEWFFDLTFHHFNT